MYLYIFEDGTIKKGTTFEDGEADACDLGILDVIDISDGEPKRYAFDSWQEIETADQ